MGAVESAHDCLMYYMSQGTTPETIAGIHVYDTCRGL